MHIISNFRVIICGSITSGVGQEDSVPVREVLLTGLGHNSSRPMLIALVEQELLVYEAFTFTEASIESHLNLRFRKVCFISSCIYRFTGSELVAMIALNCGYFLVLLMFG